MKIYVSGSIAYDEIMDFPHYFKDYFHPEKLHQINVSFAVSDLAKHLGGIATNISYSLRLTLNYFENSSSKFNFKEKYSIYPVGAVGKDGDDFLKFFKKNDIDISHAQQDKKLYTATGKVITDKSDNQIWGFYYGAAKLSPKLKAKSSKKDGEFWIVAATHEKPFTVVLKHVIKNNLPYLFDPGMTLTWISDDLLKKGVMNASYVIGNDYEIAMIEKRLKVSVKEMVAKGVNIITTLGDKGVKYDGVDVISSEVLRIGGQSREISLFKISPLRRDNRDFGRDDKKNSIKITIPAIKLTKVVDPTGAGDAWRGGFVGAFVAGRSLEECLVMGNVMASFAVETMGTVEYKVSVNEIKRRIQSISKP